MRACGPRCSLLELTRAVLNRDGSGTITFDEFKNVFAASLGSDSIPFNFDCDWIKLYLGKKDGKKAGTHVLGCTCTRTVDEQADRTSASHR